MALAVYERATWIDRPLRALGQQEIGFLILSLMFASEHTLLAQVEWDERSRVTRSYTFKGRDMCVPPPLV